MRCLETIRQCAPRQRTVQARHAVGVAAYSRNLDAGRRCQRRASLRFLIRSRGPEVAVQACGGCATQAGKFRAGRDRRRSQAPRNVADRADMAKKSRRCRQQPQADQTLAASARFQLCRPARGRVRARCIPAPRPAIATGRGQRIAAARSGLAAAQRRRRPAAVRRSSPGPRPAARSVPTARARRRSTGEQRRISNPAATTVDAIGVQAGVGTVARHDSYRTRRRC